MESYESTLAPLVFEPHAADLARRVQELVVTREPGGLVQVTRAIADAIRSGFDGPIVGRISAVVVTAIK